MSRPASLAVLLNGRHVGAIFDLGHGRSIFVFDEDHLIDLDAPILGLGFIGRSGRIVYSSRPYQRQVDPFFSNMLPEGLLRRYVEQRHDVANEYDLLTSLGSDLPGAVTLAPDAASADRAGAGLHADDPAEKIPDRFRLKFSLAGVQMKLSAHRSGDRLSLPASGTGGDWIVKLPSPRHPGVAENEFWMMELARASGFEVPQTGLIDSTDIVGFPPGIDPPPGRSFCIRRFDRDGGGRIHIEDFAQIFRLYPTDINKYRKANHELIGRVLMDAGVPQAVDYLRRLVFMIATGNGDMHIKNWSVIHRDGAAPALTPAYDWLSTVPYIRNEALALTLGGRREFNDMTGDHLIEFGESLGLRKSLARRTTVDTVSVISEQWCLMRSRIEAEIPSETFRVMEIHIDTALTKILVPARISSAGVRPKVHR